MDLPRVYGHIQYDSNVVLMSCATVVLLDGMCSILSSQDGNGKPDMSFFAPDCFHMSTKGHRGIAAALWNNMVTTTCTC